jgi:hypothetical protein
LLTRYQENIMGKLRDRRKVLRFAAAVAGGGLFAMAGVNAALSQERTMGNASNAEIVRSLNSAFFSS